MTRDRIIYLIQQLASSKATLEEQWEFAGILQSGEHEDLIKELIDRDLASDAVSRIQITPEDFKSDAIFDEIVSEGKVTETVSLPWWKTYGSWVAAAVVLFVISIGWYTSRRPIQKTSSAMVAETSVVNITSTNSKKFVRLPDGSSVLLNKASSISYSLPFTETRNVRLTGEGFFDIKKDPEHPFTVLSGSVITTVLGTAFNVNARNKEIVVSVERGLVQVGKTNAVFAKLRPNERITVNDQTDEFRFEKMQNNGELKWKNTSIVIEDQSFEETMKILSARFDVSIAISNPEIKECRVSANFLNDEPLEDILAMICGSRQATYEMKEGAVFINGGLPCQ